MFTKKFILSLCALMHSVCFSTDYLGVAERYLPNNPVIIEAGAHNGTDTVAMKQKWPQSTIYAFEPREDVYLVLTSKTQGLDNIHTFQLALGDQVGQQLFYLSNPNPNELFDWDSDAQNSLFKPLKENWPEDWDNKIKFDNSTVVNVTTLDYWSIEHKVEKVDFLWLDLQGNEFQVLNSSPRILDTVRVIKTEVSAIPLYEGTLLFNEYKKWLEDRGFTCVIDCSIFHGDALFVRSELL